MKDREKHFYDQIIYNLIYSFDQVRKKNIVNQLALEQELTNYLYPDEVVYVRKLLKRSNYHQEVGA